MKRIFMNKVSLFTVGSVYRLKRFTVGLRNSGSRTKRSKRSWRKWLRQLLRFNALVKRWDKCMDGDGGYVEK
jgi:hypothetical protein